MSDEPDGTDVVGAQRRALSSGLVRSGLRLEDLWMRYFSLGGDAGRIEVEAYLHELMLLPRLQTDLLAHALNEYVLELSDQLTVPYSSELDSARVRQPSASGPREQPSSRGPLAAVLLLEASAGAPPERLLASIEAAGDTLGVRFVVHLIDYAQRHLVPVRHDGGSGTLVTGTAAVVEATMAGRAFRRTQTVVGDADGMTTLWVPLLDGSERLGVLEVCLPAPSIASDPQLRQQCEWLAGLIGHLITVTTRYGDAFELLRRGQQRTPAAELIWTLLPPLTVATDRVVIAGQLEPNSGVGGDAFDLAVSETSAQLAIFDATGHNLASGLVVAAALAASRSVRRAGGGLAEQSRAIEQVVTEEFTDRNLFLTAVVAELDVGTGRLRYVVAGHPEPLLLREGKVVKTLTGGRRAMYGVGDPDVTPGQEDLQPGDCVVLFTDGVTEARDEHGSFFGLPRLLSLLERSAAADYPPPETVRRLLQAVLAHQHGQLQDDATVVLARWTPPVALPALDFDAIAAAGQGADGTRDTGTVVNGTDAR